LPTATPPALADPTVHIGPHGAQNPPPLDRAAPPKHHDRDPRKQTQGGRLEIGIPAGFKSEQVASFVLE